ncbi:MAG: hypothetical protein AB2793_01065 [Candidatus Thiodiazotropha sp.]
MSIQERTEKLLDEVCFCDLRTQTGIDKAEKAIRLALKEQDKLTRHACAEAVMRCGHQNLSGTAIDPNKAHAACMNAKPPQSS